MFLIAIRIFFHVLLLAGEATRVVLAGHGIVCWPGCTWQVLSELDQVHQSAGRGSTGFAGVAASRASGKASLGRRFPVELGHVIFPHRNLQCRRPPTLRRTPSSPSVSSMWPGPRRRREGGWFALDLVCAFPQNGPPARSGAQVRSFTADGSKHGPAKIREPHNWPPDLAGSQGMRDCPYLVSFEGVPRFIPQPRGFRVQVEAGDLSETATDIIVEAGLGNWTPGGWCYTGS